MGKINKTKDTETKERDENVEGDLLQYENHLHKTRDYLKMPLVLLVHLNGPAM